MNHQQSGQKSIAAWRFWLPMLLQSLLIIAVPFQSAVTFATGRTVTLQTVPLDPYDLLRGYSQTLRYEISDPEVLKKVRGGAGLLGEKRCPTPALYVVLAAPTTVSDTAVWRPVQVSCERPEALPSDQVALRGRFEGWRVVYGLETYYMPESRREDLNDQINQVQRSEEQAFVVKVKVDGQGHSVPISLWISNQEYRF